VSKRHCSNSFFYIYIFYICGDPKMGYNSSQEKNHVFSMWDKKPFDLNTSTLKDNIVSSQCRI
jgi:hypothetical protein